MHTSPSNLPYFHHYFSMPSMQFILDCRGMILDINDFGAEYLGYKREQLIGSSILSVVHAEDQERIKQQLQQISMVASDQLHSLEFAKMKKSGQIIFVQSYIRSVKTDDEKTMLFVSCHDVSIKKRARQLLAGQKKILEWIREGVSVQNILNELVRTVEAIRPDMICSILLLNPEDNRLYHGAAPSLPNDYIEAINGSEIGPNAGSCGTAAFKQELVIVSNIENDPLWKEYKHLALPYGFRSCWSVPIFSSNKKVIGTFGAYHYEACEPCEEDLEVIDTFSYLAGLALEQAQMKGELQESEQRYKSLFEHNQDPVFSLKLDGTFASINQAGERISGYSREELLTMKFHPLVVPEDLPKALDLFYEATKGNSQNMDIRIRHKHGKTLHINITAIPIIVNQKVVGVFGIAKDITERVEQNQQIRQMAYYDSLTGLPNRRLFHERVFQALCEAQQYTRKFAVLSMDLDYFKHINDSLGHHIGDMVLQKVAAMLQEQILGKGTVARMGDDEFTILLPIIHTEQEAIETAKTVLQLFREPIRLNELDFFITPSIGIAFYPHDGIDVETLLKHADMAMYEAKRKGKNGYYVYSDEVLRQTLENILLLNDLRKAIKHDELTVVYQPIIDVFTNKIMAMEALVRWHHPSYGSVPPSKFIPLAEETGLIVQIGEWMIRKACEQYQEWKKEGLELPRIAVNVSAKELQDPNFSNRIETTLKEKKMSPEWLELEITENIMIYNEKNILNNLQRMKELGVRLSIDDFGTGYSSLSYLKQLDVDTVKIDRSFVNDCPHSHYGTAITDTIISLAHHLNINVVAEGVERLEQLHYLKNKGCNEAQGYFISPPMRREEAKRLLMYGINYNFDKYA